MILGIETSTREASLAVFDRSCGKLVHEAIFTTDRAHNAVIFGPIEDIVNEFRRQLRGIVVGLGPGSYGGVRVGIAVANGLAVAMDLPVAGASSLEAWSVSADSYVVVGDARRGSFFVAEIRNRELQGEPALVEVAEVETSLRTFRERGLPLCTPDPKVAEGIEAITLSYPSAGRLAALFREREFPADSAIPLEPHYLRAPYITAPGKRKRTL